MNKAHLRLLILALFAASSLAIAGCGDDESSDEQDTITTPDVVEDAAGDDATTAPDVADDTTTPDTTVAFSWPATTAEYAGGQTSYLNAVSIPAVDANGPTCCRDWGEASRDFIVDGTDDYDNALAELNSFLTNIDFDLTPVMNERLADGSLVVLFDHFELEAPDDADGFVLAALLGQFAGATTFAEATAGSGTFEAFESAFIDGTGEPLITFGSASMASGAVQAGPSTFHLATQLTNMMLDLSISDTQLTGDAAVETGGVRYANGTLSGYIEVSEVVKLVNDYLLSDTCSCLGISAPVYTIDATGAVVGACVTDAHTLCTTEENSMCATIADHTQDGGFDVCGILPMTISSMADIDIDGDCEPGQTDCYEALSLGFEWTGVPASMTAVVP